MKQFVIIFTMILTSVVHAQFGAFFGFDRGTASNIFYNYSQLPDEFSNFYGKLNWDMSNSQRGVRTFYNASATLFEKYDYRSYHVHTLGLTAFNYISDRGSRLNTGLELSMRLHSKEYYFYEYRKARAFASAKFVLQPQLFAYVGTSATARTYPNLASYSYWKNVTYVRMSRFFNSGTTLMAELDYMIKKYIDTAANPLNNFSELYTEGDGFSQQMVGMLHLAQAISSKTGLGARLLVRRNTASSVRYLIDENGYYYSDDELFDDVFGYEAEELNAELKQRLPWNLQLQVGGSFMQKHYINRQALDFNGYPIGAGNRKDARSIASLSLTKYWSYRKSMAPLMLKLNFRYLKNESNDPYYNYKAKNVSFSISQTF